ncbi:hypothetical protein HED60_10510 [Planctomycetales bacterium ZRK34]|nr:hypothetical protein HED60_10510 [Planctomycetales bacterium ZRK34]
MKSLLTTIAALTLTTSAAFGETAGYWSFDSGQPGETAKVIASEIDPALEGKAGVNETGAPPVFSDAVPMATVWDGSTYTPANQKNEGSLQFTNDSAKDGVAPIGGDVIVPGDHAKLHSPSLTIEAFVKVNRPTSRFVLIASKRRDQTGATWSLAIDPEGRLRARFDTQTNDDPDRKGFNQGFGSSTDVADGVWHHVALTFDHETRQVALYVDYRKSGGGTTAGPLVYDNSDLVIGRGLDGWLDEVRITDQALHPEQLLRRTQFFSGMQNKPRQPVFLDQTFTRVQSALSPELQRIGTLIPKSVDEIETSMWSLGCETLDRSLADWDAYKGYLEPLGIRRIRLQGGWNRTEKKKGEYDFAWLDHIVDDAIDRGLEVCLETSYNNRLYEPGGATGPGGKLPSGEETLAAWDRWVEAMVQRYSAKGVKEWMMYNEPNLNKANTYDDIVANNIRTAQIIKRVDPEAKVGAFVLAGLNVNMLEKLLTKISDQGKLDLFEWAIYHGYSGNPDRLNPSMDALHEMLDRVAPNIRPWQGEAGCASEAVQYALSGIDWTEYSHAKWNARRMLCDIGHDVESSVFTISDLSYHKDFISRYGLLKTNPDNSIIKVKSAYYTVQNVVSVFNDALARVPDYKMTITGTDKQLTWFAFRDRETGLDVVTLWDGTELPSNDSNITPVDVEIEGGRFESPVWIDTITGNIYEIPAEQIQREGDVVRFKDVPVYDGPGVITDKSLLKFEPARASKKKKKAKKAPKPETKQAAPDVASKLKAFRLPGTQQPAPAVVILGGAEQLAGETAKWLNEQDVHAFVLTVDKGAEPKAIASEVRASLTYLRGQTGPWQIKADAIGVMALDAKAAAAAITVTKDADFTALIQTSDEQTFENLPEAKPEALFTGSKDTWQKSLAKWLEKHKGKVF